MNQEELRNELSKIWKFPFVQKAFDDEMPDIYVRDSDSHMVFTWKDWSISLKNKREIVSAINGEEVSDEFKSWIKKFKITSDSKDIFFNGHPVLWVRGWGYLTGRTQYACNLDSSTAISYQDKMLEYARKQLTNLQV